jgi:hypothetical protein
MSAERWVRLIAGVFVMVSVVMGIYMSPWFFAFTGFVGLNLLQSGLTDWCPILAILRKMGTSRA